MNWKPGIVMIFLGTLVGAQILAGGALDRILNGSKP